MSVDAVEDLLKRYADGDRGFWGARLDDVDLRGAMLDDAVFQGGSLQAVDFRVASLQRSVFSDVRSKGVTFAAQTLQVPISPKLV